MRGRPFGFGKTVPPAIHHLLDGEECDQNAAYRYGDIKRRERSHRRHAKAFEAVQKVQIDEIDHTQRHAQHDGAVEYFEEQTPSAGHRFGEHRKVEVIVAAGSGGDAEKKSIEKKGHGRLLGEKPGMTDDAKNYVR